jgi:hypothetical protein
MNIKLLYPNINVDIILPKDISREKLQKNNVNFILGYDCINAINGDPDVTKFGGENGVEKLYDIYADKSCKVFPPINFLKFIWDKKKYLTKLHKNNVPISESLFFKPNNNFNKILNQIKDNKWTSFIIKPIGGTTSYGVQLFDTNECFKKNILIKNYFEENNYFKEFIIQEYITGFKTLGEIKMFWINNQYSYAVNIKNNKYEMESVKFVTDDKILNECKIIGERSINLTPPIIVNKKKVLPVMLRTDFTCCLNNDYKKMKYYLNEIEHQDAHSYTSFTNITYPYVSVMADAFVKKAYELVELGF